MKRIIYILTIPVIVVMLYAYAGHMKFGAVVPAGTLPNHALTPGVVNQAITQATIKQTICNPAWSTKSIRPSSAYTTKLKIKQIVEYGYADFKPQDFEEDHLISLELGGNPTDPKNLWPEAYPMAHVKDSVENSLHKEICAGSLTLAQAQHIISTDWYSYYLKQGKYGSIQPISDPDDEE